MAERTYGSGWGEKYGEVTPPEPEGYGSGLREQVERAEATPPEPTGYYVQPEFRQTKTDPGAIDFGPAVIEKTRPVFVPPEPTKSAGTGYFAVAALAGLGFLLLKRKRS
jgi:hypothetical protein